MYRRRFGGNLLLSSLASSTLPHEELSQDFRFGRNLSLDLTLKPRTRTDRVGQSLCLPGRPLIDRVGECISSWQWQQLQPWRQPKKQNSDCFRVQYKVTNGSDLELRAVIMQEVTNKDKFNIKHTFLILQYIHNFSY